MSELFTKCIVGTANKKQKEEFQDKWQKRVKAVLFEEIKGLFSIEKINK